MKRRRKENDACIQGRQVKGNEIKINEKEKQLIEIKEETRKNKTIHKENKNKKRGDAH